MFRNESIIWKLKLIITCEHGGNEIPSQYLNLFKAHKSVLESHRGFDLGALDVFEYLKPLSDYSKSSTTSRLLIELNRSLHHKQLFSEYSKTLNTSEKEHIISTIYVPHRNDIESKISSFISKSETVLHLSIHSFTPTLNGIERDCDIGLLYDSRILLEKQFSAELKSQIKTKSPDLNVRFNYPYLGKADGFTTYLRRKFKKNYIGIEIEINQKHSKSNQMNQLLKDTLLVAIKNVTINF
ncbi:N-formylglutamate amidohydrolase [Psychroserpens luteus]|uniref:N-formylglutamate amidohydrolase n=1 Tax=Psychroserpens luteus TaxID=1434066 RepID=A0ABW5ZSC9_9FLAO|nr:N-formylglutamate amidohydrolase [Psychroserpens luteus]